MLIIFSGLPGVGKSTISRKLAAEIGAVYLRADTIEHAMRECGLRNDQIGGMGYVVAYRITTENLRLGNRVVVDTVNPWQLTRDDWRRAATDAGAEYVDVEIVCSDPEEHRRRIESRVSDIKDFPLPTWQDVVDREYHEWDVEPLRIDTAHAKPEDAVRIIRDSLG
jgi:predicted kinase